MLTYQDADSLLCGYKKRYTGNRRAEANRRTSTYNAIVNETHLHLSHRHESKECVRKQEDSRIRMLL